jgi:hypothetical protein
MSNGQRGLRDIRIEWKQFEDVVENIEDCWAPDEAATGQDRAYLCAIPSEAPPGARGSDGTTFAIQI